MGRLSLILLITGISGLPALTFAQNKMKISGIVTDSSKKGISLVTVRLYKPTKPDPLQMTLSKDNGSFEFTKSDTGRFILSFTHTGFVEKRQNINVQPGQDLVLDPLTMTQANGTLKDVVVSVKRPLVEQTDDKIVFNAEDDPATRTETAIDVLRKTPFVSVDGEDNVKVNGKSNFKVLLNGRETSMFARNLKEALRGFPGALISKVEVITSPSAKYDGEGIGGLINIITKKKVVGYNGTITNFSRTSDKVEMIAVNGNAKFGKTGISVFYNTGKADPVAQASSSITTPLIPSIYNQRTLIGSTTNSNNRSFGNGELSFDLDSLNTLSIYGNLNSVTNKSVLDQTITTIFPGSPSTVSLFDLNSKTENPGFSAGSDFIKKFKSKADREFDAHFYSEFGKTRNYLSSFQDNPGVDRYINNNSLANNNQYTFELDYIEPMKNASRFETGAKAIMRRASSDFKSMIKYDGSADYKSNPANTDYFKYNQDVVSLYSMYSFKVKKSNFRFGARLEYTNINGNFVSSNTLVKQNYLTFLPNIQYSHKLNKELTLILSYSKRLNRPFITDLNPFVNNNDSLNISFGNPTLNPQTIHSISAQTRYGKGNTFAGINIEGSYSGNKILDYSTFDPQTGITKTTSLNIGKEFQGNLNFNFNTRLGKWNFFSNANIRYSKITNSSMTSQSNSGFGGQFFMNTSYNFSRKFGISNFIGFWQDPVTIQSTYPFYFWYNLAFNTKFFKEKFTVSIRAVNFLEKDHDYKTTVNDRYFSTVNGYTQIRRALAVALSYNFGKLTESVSKKKGVSNDDLLNKQGPKTSN